MYSTYSSDQEFQKMFEKKKRQKQILFPGPRKPDQEAVKKMIKYLNKNPGEVTKIRALKQVWYHLKITLVDVTIEYNVF